MTSQRILLLMFASALAPASAASINFNFYNSAGTPAAENPAVLAGPAGGLGETWNQGNGASGSNLLDSTGAATTVGFTIPSSNRWNWGDPALKMIKGGAAQFGKGDNSTFTLTGLTPGGKYDIWLASYAHSTSVAERAVGAWTTSNPTSTIGSQGIDCRSKLNGDTWEAGINHVRFVNVEANGSGNIVFAGDAWDLTTNASDEWRLPLNGFQIRPAAPVIPPEPLEFTEIVRHAETDSVTLTWKSNPGEFYGLYWTDDLDGIVMHGVHHEIPAHATEKRTSLGPIPSPLPGSNKLFFLVGPPDLSNPAMSRVFGSGNVVTLVFSEPIHPDSVGNLANFSVTIGGVPLTLLSATLDSSGKNILLTLNSSLQAGTDYDVTAQNITTLAGRVIPATFNGSFQTWDNDPDGIQVFILAGQSNMVGYGKSEKGHDEIDGAIGSLRYEVVTDTANYGHLVVDPSQPATSPWKVRSDVKVWWKDGYVDATRTIRKGNLGPPFLGGANGGGAWFGPEYAFGQVIGNYFSGATERPVLLIKTAWGGISLGEGFRPPSAVAARGGQVGPYYAAMLEDAREILGKLGTEFPEWVGMGYQIAGVGWHQGWNDGGEPFASEYKDNLPDLIRDLRAEFGNPNLPFAIATTGMGGNKPTEPYPYSGYSKVEKAQLWVAGVARPAAVLSDDTRYYWRDAAVSPSSLGYHWNHNGESYYLVGKGLGDHMQTLLSQ